MTRWIVRLLVALLLVAAGWSAGRAQSSEPDFEILVSASVADTKIECVKGCTLTWSERGISPNAVRRSHFRYGCGVVNPPATCSSGKIAGWIEP
jgi:hypothetical protein